ncbi:glycoside hydrolase family 5 protein [Mycena belliarum]|uniref:Glycoside hydrolase family 5 protein n=1 Tax=Mycena belliarum TaxID=1033014 RepID=A0AAD6UE26_9AGAR|nr:glycoside hydrolase family 5 protein [Mycena belliae]
MFSHLLRAFRTAVKKCAVNLGGWLVLEPWTTPSLFDNTTLLTNGHLERFQSRATATAVLTNHWDTWITETDFAAIRAAGLNHVRLPIGYWAFKVGLGEPYIQGQLPYLKKAIDWATNYDLKLIIDLHGVTYSFVGAPGSQNGFDNSGHKVSDPRWYSNNTNVQRTEAIIKKIADMVKDNPTNVPIIAPLNEPARFISLDALAVIRQYWYDSWGKIRFPYGTSQQGNTVELIHDAFQVRMFSYPSYNGVAMDTHIYTENQMTQAEHISTVCGKQPSLSNFDKWVIVGEWTPAATDCAKYLNGRGVGSRYDGSHPVRPVYKSFLRKFWEAQVISYEKGQGWIQWYKAAFNSAFTAEIFPMTWKAENTDEWSYQAGLANGWIPSDPIDLIYPSVCG